MSAQDQSAAHNVIQQITAERNEWTYRALIAESRLAAAQRGVKAVEALCDEVERVARGSLGGSPMGYASTAVEISRVRAALAA